jgi:hypothetical protein
MPEEYEQIRSRSEGLLLIGYVWLIAGTGYWFARCIFDLGLERRPNFTPNLNMPGLVFFGVALMGCLTAVAVRRIPDSPQQIGRSSVTLTKVKDGATAVVESQGASEAGTTFWVERGVTVALHLFVAIALVLIGSKHFRDPTTGVGMASLYLILPYTAYHVSQVHHVWPAAFVLWAVFAYRRAGAAGALLGIAAASAIFPLMLVPLWIGFYRGRGAGRFLLGFAIGCGLTLAITGSLLLLSGELREYLKTLLSVGNWQPLKPPRTEGLWQGFHWAYRLPVFILYMAFVVLTSFWPTPRNFAQVIAQSAAVIIGVQFWYADEGGVYVLWYLPFILLMVFRPSLVDVRPPVPSPPTSGFMARVRRLWSRPDRLTPPSRPAGQAA